MIENGADLAAALETYGSRAVEGLGCEVLGVSSRHDGRAKHWDFEAFTVVRFQDPRSREPEFLFLSATELDVSEPGGRAIEGLRKFVEVYLTGDQARWLLGALDPAVKE